MPNFALLFDADPVIILHTLAAIIALFLGCSIFVLKKGSASHKNIGKLWVLLMLIVAISSFWISGIRWLGPFSPIHLLSIWAIWSVYVAIKHVRNGRIAAHEKSMKSLFLAALVGAGFFTFIPGRLMFEVFFG